MPVNLASPGVLVREVDLTLGQVQTSSSKTGAIVAPFARGPVDEPVLIASENELLDVFGQPSSTDRQYEGWLTIASYLSYGGIMQVVRSDNDKINNSYAGVASTDIKIKSIEDYNALAYDENIIPGYTVIARNPGSWANGVKVAFIDGRADQTFTGIGTTSAPSLVEGYGFTQLISKVAAGAGTTSLVEGELKGIITGVTSTTTDYSVDVKVLSFTPTGGKEVEVDYQQGGTWSFVAGNFDIYDSVGLVETVNNSISPRDWFDDQEVSLQSGRVSVPWNTIANRPTTTEYARNRNSRFDEVHIVIFDDTGEVTGNAGTILEKNIGISKGKDAEFSVGTPSYWRKFLANTSRYLFGGSEPEGAVPTSFEAGGNGFDPETGGEWDQQIRNTRFFSCGNKQLILENGTNYDGGTDIEQTGALQVSVGDIAAGYNNFESDDETNVDFLLMGSAAYNEAEAQSLANKLISIAERRKDALAFVSPYRASQIIDGQSGAQTVIDSETITGKVISFYSTVASSSYVVFDTGYKYMYDRFADKFRYVPLNGDIAGCCARTDQIAFPWFSPAGTTRGAILNGVRLAYNPTLIQRDRLYSARINPVIFSNDVGGITLFGDKTGLSASSAFDRINVRRLFIYVEEAITAAAQDQLFEFNDEVTRTNFVNIVEPFLRDVKSKRGITDFLVVCDETNNTPAVVDRNEFVADIFIKPTRSINFIGLTFVATRTGVNFEEVVGTV
ncbi:tail sheath [Synechococcus phage S-CAM7]|uniref:Tail sheath protein n=1 Tax=Synechococcus phage S-CAM7 TaxID=1883368 RepID=A0A1D8KTS1_9CAUD|nr:tail sheath [Synechococcus phage S-CAM7]AOV62065.1 tail sheath protein [Synechococcus phage S-CAM7]QLF86192.1 tail sheath protein [Synechococcus phage S-CAM7]